MATRRLPSRLIALVGLLAFALAIGRLAASGPRFRSDDPLAREPETQDASHAQEWTIDLFTDLALNLFGSPGDEAVGVPAQDVNTVDEVPDSSWFTNRIVARPLSINEVLHGPETGPGPAPGRLAVVSAKETGFAPGFTVKDSAGERWFISFDAAGYPESATGAIVVANRIFWALGYWQVDNQLTRIWPEQITIGDKAMLTPMSGRRRPMRVSDLEDVWRRAHRSADGSFRAVAARALPGRPLGGFRYYGTRPDDPNDIVPHEHRRTLRALQVFGAWTNLVDMKAGNTLDMLVTDNGRPLVRHYLQDVGSTFGAGANGPREFDEGWEHLYEGDLVWRRFWSLGFVIRPWMTADYEDIPAIGRFEGDAFDPTLWKPRVPTAALRHAQPDDLFWAARRVATFSDEMLRAIVTTAQYSDPAATRHLADVLIKRRDKIASAYLTSVNPLVNFALSPEGVLSFENAAASAHLVSESVSYRVMWARFDNATDTVTPLGDSTVTAGQSIASPVRLSGDVGSFVCVTVTTAGTAGPSQRNHLRAYFRRTGSGWKLVGLDRSDGRSNELHPAVTGTTNDNSH